MNDAEGNDGDPFGMPFAWDAAVVIFYAPVILGSLLWLLMLGGEWAVWDRLLGDHPFRAVLVGVFVGLGLVVGTRLLAQLGPGARALAALQRMMGRMTVLSCLVMAVTSALGEELFFRAVLQPQVGVVIAALCFAAAHVPIERDLWPWPIGAFGAGILFGLMFDVDGAIAAPATAHFVLNFVNLLWLTRQYRPA